MVILGNRLEQCGAQCRREGQRQQAREQDGDRQRQRELTVDHAHRATHEGQGQEHGHQHQRDADDGPRDLLHGLHRGSQRGEALLGHDALHVLHHHNGIVDQNADGQHHAEHGHHIDREAQRIHHRQGTGQTHRDHDGGNQRIAQVLQKQPHHQEHQHHGLDQGLDHLADGDFNKARGVVGHCVLNIVGEVLRQLG